jgi:hypothetical protein
MWLWFVTAPIGWWLFGLPTGGAVVPLLFLWPPAVTSVVAMAVVLASVAFLSRRALNY